MPARVGAGWDQGARANKYRARKASVDGAKFDSRKEARRYHALLQLMRDKHEPIFDLRRQVRFPLYGQHGPIVSDSGRPLCYVADFVYREWNGREVIEDVKGFRTPEYVLKKAIMRAMGHEISEV